MEVSTIGVDIAKRIFQLHGVDKHGKTLFKKKLMSISHSKKRLYAYELKIKRYKNQLFFPLHLPVNSVIY